MVREVTEVDLIFIISSLRTKTGLIWGSISQLESEEKISLNTCGNLGLTWFLKSQAKPTKFLVAIQIASLF